jgi:gamma-glutamyltranspeptidase/glutathione hydrolase
MSSGDGASGRPTVGRSMVITKYGIVAASQPLAARAGVDVLERGGNAVDAAIATNAAMGVMEPTGNGIGGDLFALVYEAKTGKLHGLNASGWSPAGLTAEFLRAQGHSRMPELGIHTVTVPGVVAGWEALSRRFGALSFSELLAPAIFYAENGFPVTEVVARLWSRSVELLASHPHSKQVFLPDSRAPRVGEIFANPALAASLRRIAVEGKNGFYAGATAEAIVGISKETGGALSLDDLADFEAEWVSPLTTTYRGWSVAELPPNGQGIAALIMLNLMERFPLGRYGFHSPEALHVMIEAKKLAYADLLRYVGDPKFSRIPVAELLSKEQAARRALEIDPARARSEVLPSRLEGLGSVPGGETIYLAVVDQEGNIVSLIQSNYYGFGSGLVPAGCGFMLQNRGALFALEPGQPNTLEPRKRPLHTIIPGFIEKEGARIGFGIMGGWNQAQAHAQFVANLVDYELNLQEALEAGRFSKPTFDGLDVAIEALVPEPARRELARLGHELLVVPPRTEVFGFGQAVLRTPEGVNFGASEPRHDGMAIPQAPPVFGRR